MLPVKPQPNPGRWRLSYSMPIIQRFTVPHSFTDTLVNLRQIISRIGRSGR